ncbi:hypothetical protein EV644_110165 [Kribbella orskensis]|uniref:Siderophore-interacting protein n=1 Tax=Kribbella orskensis TaxID=2512216 RepID=A0ABY2BGH7_9ACTN|nr:MULTISPECIES: hypothetical protein [Kribbella]TCN38030.1 hypothetical protein EV642_110187 [Kribbella sp. VKM Ac-2500]TCO19517.1 hypothetical protein EV644_110165 [Kribbella orskensis]
MSYDVVALIDGRPSYKDVLAGMLAAGPDWLVRDVSDGAVLQLCDPEGQPMASLESPILIQVPGEVERLLGPEVSGVQTPVWWAEVRATPREGAAELADRYAATLVERLGGQVWKSAVAGPPAVVPNGAGGNNA